MELRCFHSIHANLMKASDGQMKAFKLHVLKQDAGLHPCMRMPLAWFLLERLNIVSSGKEALFANNFS